MITNQWICGNGDLADVIAVRESVFVAEQGFAREDEFDLFDEQAMHVVIYDGERPIGTGRLYHDGKTFKIGRLCVLAEERGQGVGDLMMRLLLVKAFEFDPSEVRLDAQERAKGFYENFGFEADGAVVHEAGIPHVPMRVTKESLLLKSGCGKELRYGDLFPAK
ncbi:MAG: GNAT family N-acetyltransferase [Christensenella sp.]|uniref:GNAT family N-acetyltransferase n=1 Tax=Christensenella sp. TaxID=1935934 RepID=UPI002B1EDB26|nr:GNAT family N-acetyltransferase [Christensenella sp.]MEA5003103.1 GNAT family N-acetyltransferase [Christensenella sp.]